MMWPSRMKRLFRFWLLALVLLLGQAAMLAHVAEHVDSEPAAASCLVCLAGQNLDGSAPPSYVPPVSVQPVRMTVLVVAAPAVPEQFCLRRQGRGPPTA